MPYDIIQMLYLKMVIFFITVNCYKGLMSNTFVTICTSVLISLQLNKICLLCERRNVCASLVLVAKKAMFEWRHQTHGP